MASADPVEMPTAAALLWVLIEDYVRPHEACIPRSASRMTAF